MDSPYTLRHTCLTRWAEVMDPYTLAYLAGHSDFATTRRYVHSRKETVLHAIERAQKASGVSAVFSVISVARPEGLEPPAYWFEANRSIQLSYGRGSGNRDLMVSPRKAALKYACTKICVAMDNSQIQAAMKELHDAMVVMAHMEARQTDRLLRQEKEIEELALLRARAE
jgi:hypothetical protein